MDILRSMEEVLQRGCGLSLEEATKKNETLLQEMENALRTLQEGSGTTDEEIALHAGNQLFGLLLNTMSEEQAIAQAQKGSPVQFGHGHAYRDIIKMIGKELVEAAGENLTPEILGMAERWKGAGADEQIAITKELCSELVSYDQLRNKWDELNFSTLQRSIGWKLRVKMESSVRHVLPREYGVWSRETCIANCQGKTQMLVAFARQVGAEVFVVGPEETAKDRSGRVIRRIFKALQEDMEQRNILHGDQHLFEGLASQGILDTYNELVHSFHLCVVIQVSDGRWVMVDPHAICWGVVPEEWNINEKVELLKKYREALPGLSVICQTEKADEDDEVVVGWEQQAMAWTEKLLTISRRIEQAYEQDPENANMLIGQIMKYRVVAITIALHEWREANADNFARPDEAIAILESINLDEEGEEDAGWDVLNWEDSLQIRERMGAMLTLFGPDELGMSEGGSDADPFMMLPAFGAAFRWMQDEEWRKKRMGAVLTSLHWIATELLKDWIVFGGGALHSNFFLANPDSDLAIAAINTMMPCGRGVEQQFFLDYGFDATGLYNVIVQHWCGAIGSEHEIVQWARRVLEEIPFKHPLITQILERERR